MKRMVSGLLVAILTPLAMIPLWLIAQDNHDNEDGTLITFDVPGAGTSAGQGTEALVGAISPSGAVTGPYIDASNVYHGFLRTPDGTITTFDAPGAGTAAGQGTGPGNVSCLNPRGSIAGGYTDANNMTHAFIRAPDGTFTTFDGPGAATFTFADSINPAGAVTAFYADASGVLHGLLRTPDGTITTFDVPGAGTAAGQGTDAANLNPSLDITGFVIDANSVSHGFVRSRDGTITTFDVPGAGTGTGQGTFPFSNNPAGAITGYYIDGNNVFHGFLRCRGGQCR